MTTHARGILIVEDDAPIAETIIYALETEGFVPVWTSTLTEARAAFGRQEISLVILDVGLPDGNGLDLCREIRAVRPVPIIFLTARSGEVDRIVGLELGADDYIAKPFSPRELTARVRAVLRRSTAPTATPHSVASPAPPPEWQHDASRCQIRFRGRALELTRNEYRLLQVLLQQPGRVLSREQLLAAAWEDPTAALDRTVDAHIKTVRAKLKLAAPAADPIATHRGLGYSLREAS